MEGLANLSPLSRDPYIKFRNVEYHPYETPIPCSAAAENIGTVSATGELPGWAPTPMYYRVIRTKEGSILLGQRCGLLHTPHINARQQAAETLWCMNCWCDPSGTGKGSLIVPFYMYYRHYDDHILGHLPACACGKQFQIWDLDEPLKDGYTYLFSAYKNQSLKEQVEALLVKASQSS
jgi:hypothetical protein